MVLPGGGGCPPQYFFLELVSWSMLILELVKNDQFLSFFTLFFRKLTVENEKKNYYWIKFHYQIGYKWPVSDQKVTNCSFDLNMLRNLLVSWWKCSWSEQPIVGQNDQHLVKNDQHLGEIPCTGIWKWKTIKNEAFRIDWR